MELRGQEVEFINVRHLMLPEISVRSTRNYYSGWYVPCKEARYRNVLWRVKYCSGATVREHAGNEIESHFGFKRP